MSETLLRVIPTESLAEDAMLELVEYIEAFVADKLGRDQPPVSLVAQVTLFEPLSRLTAVVQYEDEAVAAAMLSVRGAAFLSGCRDSVSLPGISKMHQAKFYCITRCVALKRTRATFPCAAPRHNSSPSRCAARADLAEISRRTRAVIF